MRKALVVSLLLCGCVSPEVARQREEAQMREIVAAIQARCTLRGARTDDQMAQCFMQEVDRAQERAFILNAIQSSRPVYVAPQPQQRYPMPQRTECQRIGNRVECFTQ